MKKVARFCCSGVFMLASNALFAQQSLNDTVRIVENRLPGQDVLNVPRNTSVLSSLDLKSLPSRDLNESLQFVNGVQMFQRGPNGVQADLVIDGGTFDQGLLLINGFKVSDFQTGHNQMNIPFSINAIQSVQVLRGAQSRLFGPGALSGAVNIQILPSKKNEVNVHSYVGSNFLTDTSTGDNFLRMGTMVAGSLGTAKNRFLINLIADSSSGYRFNTGSKRLAASVVGTHKINSKVSLLSTLGYNNNYYGAGYFYAAPADSRAKERVETFFGALQLNLKLRKGWNANARMYTRSNYDHYVFIKTNPSVYQNKHFSKGYNLEVHASKINKWGVLGIGSEHRTQSIKSNNLGDRSRNNTGIYLEQRFTNLTRTTVAAGFYGNYNTDYGFSLFPGIEVSHKLEPNLSIYANINRGMRAPTFTDLYYSDRSNVGNSDLNPENGTTTHVGIKLSEKKVFFQSSIYSRNLNNMIVWRDTDTTQARLWKPENVGNVTFYGFDFSLVANSIRLVKSLNLNLKTSYNYLNNTNNLQDTKTPILALRHQLIQSLGLSYKNLSFMCLGRYQKQLDNYDYLLMDTRISYEMGNHRLYLDVNNIFNKAYTTADVIPMPGRYFTVGLMLNF